MVQTRLNEEFGNFEKIERVDVFQWTRSKVHFVQRGTVKQDKDTRTITYTRTNEKKEEINGDWIRQLRRKGTLLEISLKGNAKWN